MIITLKGADFSASNIGTLSSWRISRSLGAGATYEGVTSVDKGAAFSATVTLAEGYEVGTAGVTVTMGGTVLSGAHAMEGNVITITIASVTGNVLIKVPTVNTATGEEEEPEVPDSREFALIGTTAGYFIDNRTDNLSNTAMDAMSINKYSVSEGQKISIICRCGPVTCICWNDANGKRTIAINGTDYIDGQSTNINTTITVPSNTYYLEVSYANAHECSVTLVG
jgi:hypothetical protein